MIELLRNLLHEILPRTEPWRSSVREVIFIAAMAVLVISAELFNRRDMRRYVSRNFANDLVYSFFYQGGYYNLLYIPLFSFLQTRMGFFDLHLLDGLKPAVAFVAFWLTADFLGYWIHRLQHSIPFLWAFHSVHHTQKRLTFLTSNRLHPIDQVVANCLMFFPILILGTPRSVWVPFLLLHSFLESLQHASLTWKFGPLYRLVVSPMFHNLHHSTKAGEYNGNYAKILSVWDFVFGTAVTGDVLPAEFGVEGLDMPENLAAQFVMPFRMIWGQKATIAPPVAAEPAP